MDYFIASKEEVLDFLKLLREVINSDKFNIDAQFTFDYNKFENATMIAELEYSLKDVLREISELKLENYSQSVPDLQRKDNIPYQVFFKTVNNRETYIKVKIKNNNIIICKSFHYAKFSRLNNPYVD